jgi:type IV pilus assembly protein PilQ
MDSTNNKSRGIQFPREIAAGSVDADAIDLSEYAVDALPGTANLGTLGLRLGSVSDIFKLDLKLQYLENESLGRVVSRPSISVLDNKTAKITQGARVPFLSSSSSGTNVSFQDVGINIEVTPQITSDGAVILKISTKSNEVQNQSVGGNPITTIREANTEMLVKSGKTAVLGGVFKTSETRSSAGVPGLMRLPLLGWLFSNSSKTQTKEETLVFITPYILNDNRVANAAPNSEANLEP